MSGPEMTGPRHYRESERLLESVMDPDGNVSLDDVGGERRRDRPGLLPGPDPGCYRAATLLSSSSRLTIPEVRRLITIVNRPPHAALPRCQSPRSESPGVSRRGRGLAELVAAGPTDTWLKHPKTEERARAVRGRGWTYQPHNHERTPRHERRARAAGRDRGVPALRRAAHRGDGG